MTFCDVCGTYLKKTKDGYWCPKCRKVINTKIKPEHTNVNKTRSDAILVVENRQEDATRISKACPRCGNGQALYWSSSISGEHAGVTQERMIERFKCARCAHLWTESS